jgi:hypothetical protein
MSHYLERLASSTLKLGENIHPVLDSLFSGPKVWSATGSPQIEETQFVSAAATPHSAGAPAASAVSAQPSETASGPDAHWTKRTEDVKTNPAITPSELLLPQQHAMRPAISFDRTTGAESPVDADAPVSSGSNLPVEISNTDNQPTRTKAMRPHERSSRPLIAAPFVPQESNGILSSRPPALGTIDWERKPRNAGVSKNLNNTMREPDEIQIHIGRIEVTAVHALAPAAAVSEPRKSAPSLDEYLRRRDRRVS